MTQAEVRKLDEELAKRLIRIDPDQAADLLAGFLRSLGFEKASAAYDLIRSHA